MNTNEQADRTNTTKPRSRTSTFCDLTMEVQHLSKRMNWWKTRNDAHGIGPIMDATVGIITQYVVEAQKAAERDKQETWRDASNRDTLVRRLASAWICTVDIACHFQLQLLSAFAIETNVPPGKLSWASWMCAVSKSRPLDGYPMANLPHDHPCSGTRLHVVIALNAITDAIATTAKKVSWQAHCSWNEFECESSFVRHIARTVAIIMDVANVRGLPLQEAIRAELDSWYAANDDKEDKP